MKTKIFFKTAFVIIFLTVLVVTFNSCTYEPTGVNYIKVDSTYTTSTMQLVLPDTSKDTIVVITRKINDNYYISVYFKILVDQERLNYVRFNLDGVQIGDGKGTDGTVNFWLPPEQLYKVHNIELIASTNSGTGSVADKMKKEGIILSHKWYFVPTLGIDDIAKQYLSNFMLLFTQEKNGLHLYWDTTNLHVLTSINLYKKLPNNGLVKKIASLSIKNTEFTDEDYTGEKASYYMQFVSDNQTFNSVVTDVSQDLPDLFTESIDESSLKIKWNKSKYPESFGYYYLVNTNNEYFAPIEIDDINKTDITINKIIFGQATNVSLYVIPKSGNKDGLNDKGFYKTLLVSNGDPAIGFYDKPLISKNYLLARKNSIGINYSLYNLSTLKYLDSSKFMSGDLNAKYSASGKSLIFRNASKYYFESFNGDFKGLTNEDMYYISSKDYFQYSNQMSGLSISDNSTIFVNVGSYLYLFNYVQRRTIAETQVSFVPDELDITSDGQFFFARSGMNLYCYKVVNSSFVLINSIPNVQKYIVKPDEDKIIFSDGNQISSYGAVLNSEQTLTVNSGLLENIDFDAGVVLTYNSLLKVLNVLDLTNDFNKITTIPAEAANYFIHGDYVYSDKGYRINYRK